MKQGEKNGMDWDDLVQKHGNKLLLYARQWIKSAPDAQETVQEGFIKFWRFSQTHKVDNPVPSLYTAVRQCALDRIRSAIRRQNREKTAGETLYENQPIFQSSLEKQELQSAVQEALSKLPEAQREVLVMKIWGNLTFAEIAESLEIPPNTAASRYRYALAAMENLLKDCK